MPFDNFHYYPYASRNLPVSIETPPLEYCPVTKIKYYEVSNTWFASNVSSWNAPLERIEVSATFDYSDYEAALALAGISGIFDTNFQDVTVCISDAAPVGLPVCVETITDITLTYNVGEVVIKATFRPDEAWAGQIKYVSLVVHFIHDGQDDYIVIPFAIVTAVQGERYDTTEPFNSLAWYKDGVAIDNLCSDGPKGEVELWVEHDQAGWDVMVIMTRNDEYVSEYDAFASTNFPTLTESPILNVVSSAIMGGQREVITVDESLLQGDECFIVVIKNNAGDPVLDVCEDVFDVELDVTAWSNLKIDYAVSPAVPDFSKIVFTLTFTGKPGLPCSIVVESALDVDIIDVVNSCFTSTWYSDPYNIVLCAMTAEVQTIHGCFYLQTQYFEITYEGPTIVPLTFSFT